jgi:hypothetical protein
MVGESQNSLPSQISLLSQSEMSRSPIHLSLSPEGRQRLQAASHERDFAFVIGDERYPCPSFVSEFLSPRITSHRPEDITMNEFSIEIEDPNHSFEIFLSIGQGDEVSLSRRDLKFVRSICSELWNSELFEAILDQEHGEMKEDELRTRIGQVLNGE